MYKYVIEDKNCMLNIPIECCVVGLGLVEYKTKDETFVIESHSKLSIELINRVLVYVKLMAYADLAENDGIDYTSFKSFEQMNYKLKKGKTND